MTVSLSRLRLLYSKCEGRVKYRLGAKAPSLTADSNVITHIDCSGFLRWLLARASDQTLRLPDGSVRQAAWCEQHLRRLEHPSDVAYARDDPGRLFIVFLRPSAIRPRSAGHVWLVCEGRTIESRGGVGVSSRAWDTSVLRDHASAAYEVPAGP